MAPVTGLEVVATPLFFLNLFFSIRVQFVETHLNDEFALLK